MNLRAPYYASAMRKIVLLFAASLPLSCGLIGADLTTKQANAVELGMTMTEVEEILGQPNRVANKPGFTAHFYLGIDIFMTIKYVNDVVAETSPTRKEEWLD